MNQPSDPQLLADLARRMAARLTEDQTSLAWVFTRYQASERLDDDGLARVLGVAPDLLPRLAICGRPRPDHFPGDIRAIADRFGADVGQMARIVRQVDALDALYQSPAAAAGALLAARDRVAEENAGYQTETEDADDTPARDDRADDDDGASR